MLFSFLLTLLCSESLARPDNSCSGPRFQDEILRTGESFQEGCIVYNCNLGMLKKSIADDCKELLGSLFTEQSFQKGLLSKSGSHFQYQNPGIIVTGGCTTCPAQLYKPLTGKTCKLPTMPTQFMASSFDLLGGLPTICGSRSPDLGPDGQVRRKNESDKVSYSPQRSCLQLTPQTPTKAEWTLLVNDLRPMSDHVSLVVSDGILLMGGSDSLQVDLLKEDGSKVEEVFNLQRKIDGACGITDGMSLIITGGGTWMDPRGYYEVGSSEKVARYNRMGHQEDLPDMMTSRKFHGCGYFFQEGRGKVFVVAGGYNDLDPHMPILPTETYASGEVTWQLSTPLPRKFAVQPFGSATINGVNYFIEGNLKPNNKKASLLELEVGETWKDHGEVMDYGGWRGAASGISTLVVDLNTTPFEDMCE